MKSIVYFLLIALFSNCQNKDKELRTSQGFKLPFIKSGKHPESSPIQLDSLGYWNALFVGVYHFNDTPNLHLPFDSIRRKLFSCENCFAYEHSALGDTSLNKYEWYDKKIHELYKSSAAAVTVKVDTTKTINLYGDSIDYIPIYLINESHKSSAFKGNCSVASFIIEAYGYGYWYPITHCFRECCTGPNYFAELKPDSYGLFLVPKTTGVFKTKLRLRIFYGNNIYVSEEYSGFIDPSAFFLPKGETPYNYNYFKHVYFWEFTGSLPLDFKIEKDTKNAREVYGEKLPLSAVPLKP